jgi:CspA family cold shock protein
MSIKNILQAIKNFFIKPQAGKKISGTIKFFDRKKRFGFIVAGKKEYFFHAAATRPADFKLLQDGVAVRFSLSQGKKGPQADHIEIIK